MGTLLNRRRYMGGGSSLPYDAEIEYLQSSGTQYIDTGITCSTSHEIRASMMGAGERAGANAYMFFGEGKRYDNYNIELYSGTSQYQVACCIYGYTNMNYDYTQYFNVVVKDKVFTFSDINGDINGTASRESEADFTAAYTMNIFSLHRASVLISSKPVRCYKFQILLNNTLLIDLIPVRVGQVGYMYDRVSGELFGNAGTGSFTLGSDKT